VTFENITAVFLKITAFWDVVSCSLKHFIIQLMHTTRKRRFIKIY